MKRDGKTLQQVTFTIEYHEYESGDPEFPDPDKGWYVNVALPSGESFDLGPDHFGDGFASADEALALCEKWAVARGFEYRPPVIQVVVGRWV